MSANQNSVITYTGDNITSTTDIDQSLIDNSSSNKTFMQRYFGKMQQGSLRGSIFALLASAMGTGVFNLPSRAQQIGIFSFIIFVFLGGLFSLIGMVLMVRLIRQFKFLSYSQMSFKAYGNPLKRLSQFCNIVYPWGITICFQVIFAKFICQLLHDQFNIDLYEDRSKQIYNNFGNQIRVYSNIGCFALALLFALKKDVSILQKIAIVGVVSAIFNISVVIIISLVGFTRPDDHIHYNSLFKTDYQKVNWLPKTHGAGVFSILAQAMASILFCYVNHQMLFPLCNSLKRPTQSRFKKIIHRVHIIQFLAYAFIGICAYLLLVQHIDQHQIDSVVISSIPVTIVTVGKVLMLFALFFAVPLNMYPARQSLFDAAQLDMNNNKHHYGVTIGMTVSSTLIAIFFVNVNSYFGLLGGTAGVMMAGGIPSLCYIKLKDKITTSDTILLVLCGVVTVIAVIGAILSVVA